MEEPKKTIKKPKICKDIELASNLFEDGAVAEAIIILEKALDDMKEVSKARKIIRNRMGGQNA